MTSTASNDFPLATEDPYTGGNNVPGSATGDAAGASGSSTGAAGLSRGAMIAIIVIVVGVAVLGTSMAVLFYVAKKREWKIRENIRRSAKKVVAALTPRRSEFPKELKDDAPRGKSSRGRTRLADVPPTPRLRPEDVEKGLAKASMRETSDKRNSKSGKGNKWPLK